MISASGVPCNSEGSGDWDGCGVGRGGSSGVEEMRELRVGALFLFRGDALFEGDSGSCCTLCSGSKFSGGSTFSFARLLLDRPPVLGVAMEFVVFLLDAGAFRGLRLVAGAGVKSSSLSSCILDCMISSSSSDSRTTFLRAAALLEGLTGDSDIFKLESICKARCFV